MNSLNGNGSHESVQPWSSRYPYQTYEKGYWDGYRKRYDELHKLKARKDIWIPWICGIGILFFFWYFNPAHQAKMEADSVRYVIGQLKAAHLPITADNIEQQLKENAQEQLDQRDGPENEWGP